jgi:glucose-6-phosphate isomerase
LANKYNRHYAVGMEANGSKIKSINYPLDTKRKFPHWESPTRNCKHMWIELEDGNIVRDDELILKKDMEAIQKMEKFISDISGGVA